MMESTGISKQNSANLNLKIYWLNISYQTEAQRHLESMFYQLFGSATCGHGGKTVM